MELNQLLTAIWLLVKIVSLPCSCTKLANLPSRPLFMDWALPFTGSTSTLSPKSPDRSSSPYLDFHRASTTKSEVYSTGESWNSTKNTVTLSAPGQTTCPWMGPSDGPKSLDIVVAASLSFLTGMTFTNKGTARPCLSSQPIEKVIDASAG